MLTARQRLFALLVLVAGLLVPGLAQAREQARHHPVIFVHGYNADPGVWGGLREDFRAAGYSDSELFSWGYDTHRPRRVVTAPACAVSAAADPR